MRTRADTTITTFQSFCNAKARRSVRCHAESPHRYALVTDLRKHDRCDETGDGRDAEDTGGHQVGADQTAALAHTDARDEQDNGQVEGPDSEFYTLAGVGDPAEYGGTLS